ncbi:hypothetical protein [Modestobacter sp. Leaf380]|uniref:hypothetical protein n=1 Tax=Modestobacter sp. Leaf380 TaxID=1736356 RepID=UPI0006FBA9F7|nr:hypothetical protein [Modestobacter sp. Leaf380]KQS69276.1 hypothetical protein ASG41_21940 [Modestobacter sp. Leaf380]
MSEEMWVVRAGERARYVEEFLNGSYIAVHFTDVAPDDLRLTDEADLKARASSPAETAYARQLVSFGYRIEVGDLVIVPRLTKGHRDYLVARVVGAYEYTPDAPQSGPHRRRVEWLGRFLRDDISEAAANTMGSLSTVFRPTAVEAEFRGLLTALAPISDAAIAATRSQPSHAPTPSAALAPTAAVTSKPDNTSRPTSVAQLDIDVDERGRARITCPYPALVMEQTPRHVDLGRDWAGVPGIYVLTGTELQQSSSRTGHERTLTTTLIVRPWAYVGLSEDFFGRLSSHRQSKPEWRRALLVRSGGQPFSSDDIKYLEERVHAVLADTDEVALDQSKPRGNLSARPRNPALLDACANSVVAVLRLTGTLI